MTPHQDQQPLFDERSVKRRFDRAAAHFEDADFVHRHAAAGLLERLAPMRLAPALVLDVGAATGSTSRELARRYRKARVLCVDVSLAMLARARSQRSRFARIREIQAEPAHLPLADGSVDLLFANLYLPWSGDPPRFFGEVRRVLRKEGLFAFATLGPDSLRELREAWDAAGGGAHVNPFPDMHDVGDAILRAGLADPVLDVDQLSVRWPDSGALFRDLTAAGARNSLARRRASLTGKQRFAAMREHLETRLAAAAASFEIVFGHAWGTGPAPPPGEYRLDVGAIGRRVRR
ncbi:MAG TPA: methyltransferase domain-containing protein [Woeseiaceae bacterium]